MKIRKALILAWALAAAALSLPAFAANIVNIPSGTYIGFMS